MRHFTLAILAAAAAIAFASCEKPPVEPENPTPVGPIDDPTTAGGITDQLVEFLTNEQGDTTAFQISYTSWMEVDGEKVSVPLKVYYRVLDTTYNLQNGASGMAYDDEVYGYRRCGELHDGAVTIVDSAIYRIFSCREYSFELECRYESAAYNTGNTSQTMPYRRVKKIIMSSLGKPIDAEVINGCMHVVLRFECKIFIDNEVYYVPFRITETWPYS